MVLQRLTSRFVGWTCHRVMHYIRLNQRGDPSIPVADASTETDDIVYRISHDLRASVRALQELPIWISEDLDKASIALPKPTARHLEMITNHATRLDLMLTGLLEHSRVGRMQPISAVRPMEVLEDVMEDFGTPDGVDIEVKMEATTKTTPPNP